MLKAALAGNGTSGPPPVSASPTIVDRPSGSGRHDVDDVRLDLPVPLRNVDTRPETQASRGSKSALIASASESPKWARKWEEEDAWRPPASARLEEPPQGARLEAGFGRVQVRSFQVRGFFALAVALVFALALLALVVALFAFALGLGAALAVGGAVAALAGLGVARVRKALGSASGMTRSSRDSASHRGPGPHDLGE